MYFVSGGVYDIAKEGIISMVFGGGAPTSPETIPPQNQQPGGPAGGYQNSSSTFYDASGSSDHGSAKMCTNPKGTNQFSSNQEHSSFGGSGAAGQFHQQQTNNFDFNNPNNDALHIRNTTRG